MAECGTCFIDELYGTCTRSESEKRHHMNIVPHFEYLSMVESCLKKYTPYHKLLVQHFCEELGDENNVQNELLKLLHIYEKVFEKNYGLTDLSYTSAQPVHSKSDLCPQELKCSGLWEYCPHDGLDWETVPLGCLPGEVLNHTDLEFVQHNEVELLADDISDDSDVDEMEIMEFSDVTIENIHSRSSILPQTLESYVKNKTLAYLH